MIPRKVIKTRVASEDELEWIKYGRKLCQDSPDIIDAQAKTLVTLASSLLVVYTSAITLFKIPENLNEIIAHLVGANTYSGFWFALIKLLVLGMPIGFWLWSIKSSLNVYDPITYEISNHLSPDQVAQIYEKITRSKYDKLKKAMKYFLRALIWSAACVGIISIFAFPNTVPPEPQDVQFILTSSGIPAFQSMSIGWNETNMTTMPMQMLDESDVSIKVQLDGGRMAKFNKTLIQGIIYLKSVGS